ncbi:hypothetical protein CRE_18026 [Caenorhabditis remanei]|uniref:Uncharacterized protein n=1 Tax=Caenorhabditis remanei TaxID=31234 RepID=E3MTU6_CAERE|nr:hypothetical protein CRE_18026 [Caenorhabditis remanei]
MEDDDDKPDRQVESIRLELNEEVMDKDELKNVWVAQRMLGKGAFGTVYHVYNKISKQEAALKQHRAVVPVVNKMTHNPHNKKKQPL